MNIQCSVHVATISHRHCTHFVILGDVVKILIEKYYESYLHLRLGK